MSIENHAELKRLTTNRVKLVSEVAVLNKQISELREQANKKNGEIFSIDRSIEKLKEKDIIITEHAIIRYLERVMKIDIKELKEKILTDKIKEMIKKLGNGKYPNNELGFRIVVRDNTVVTIE